LIRPQRSGRRRASCAAGCGRSAGSAAPGRDASSSGRCGRPAKRNPAVPMGLCDGWGECGKALIAFDATWLIDTDWGRRLHTALIFDSFREPTVAFIPVARPLQNEPNSHPAAQQAGRHRDYGYGERLGGSHRGTHKSGTMFMICILISLCFFLHNGRPTISHITSRSGPDPIPAQSFR
jgi:hypothetical protein